jgi:hypothetical protein
MGGSEVAAIASESRLPIQYMMYFLEHIHTVSGVPWYVLDPLAQPVSPITNLYYHCILKL